MTKKDKTTKETKNIHSRAINPATLEDPQSRSEMYFHFINRTGKVTFDQLPKPQSRLEYHLYYICEQMHLGNIGGESSSGNTTATNVSINSINGIQATNVQTALEKIKENIDNIDIDNYAKNTEKNVFTKDNWFDDLLVTKIDSVSNEHYGVINSDGTSNRFFGVREQSSDKFDGYISHLRIYIHKAFANTNDKVSGVTVHMMEKKNDTASDIYIGELFSIANYKILDKANKPYIEIPVYRKFDTNVYLVVKTTSTRSFESISNIVNTEYVTEVVNFPNLPQVNAAIAGNSTNYCANMQTFGATNVKDAINKIKKASEVYSIENVKDIIEENATFDNQNTILTSNTVKDALLEMANIVANSIIEVSLDTYSRQLVFKKFNGQIVRRDFDNLL